MGYSKAAHTRFYHRFRTIPGVGRLTALAIEVFAPEMKHFKCGRDFAAWLGRRSIVEGSWLARMMTRKPKMLVAIALANKMARTIWAMLTKHEDYRDPELTAAA